MALTFTTSPTFVAGEIITSEQHIALAEAFNDRLRSGVGDPCYRIHWLIAGGFRQVRAPDCAAPAACLWPTNLEYEEFYEHINPESGYVWPDIAPGSPGGPNLGSPFMAYHFGNPGLDSEANRLAIVPLDNDGSLSSLWQLGKSQRGIYDPTTENINAPALSAAESYQQIVHNPGAFHGKAYGGYFPTTGGVSLQFGDGDQIARLGLNSFITDFRGTDGQRANEDFTITNIAFDYQRFFESQHHLSPNIGHMDAGKLVDDYPTFTFGPGATIAAGTTTSAHQYANDFSLGGFLVVASQLVGAVQIEALDDGGVIHTFTVSETIPQYLKVFDTASTPNLSFRLKTEAAFSTGSGRIDIEASEIFERKPERHDADLVLRLSSCKSSGFSGTDTRGIDTDQSKQMSNNYFKYGCIKNINGAATPDEDTENVNLNPVVDAARRFIRSVSRVVPAGQIVGYEVADGKSVLYFKRYALGNSLADSFEGIAPAIGETEAEGIIHTPGLREHSNEWLMFTQLKVYHPSESSLWKPDAFARYYGFNERCHFYSGLIDKNTNADLLVHGTQGPPYGDFLIQGEYPTGYRYAGTSNPLTGFSDTDKLHFYRSCRIYEPDYEVDSATCFNEAGTEMVKLVFTGRFQHCDEAPATISRDISTWDRPALHAEPYRTDENAIRCYLVLQSFASDHEQLKTGDTGMLSVASGLPDNPFGGIWPHFFFTKLVTFPHEDTPPNATVEEASDTMITVDRFRQMELYLRAICEGYIDETRTQANSCQMESPVPSDYTFGNLCQDAFGGDTITILDKNVRWVQGFGPQVNTEIAADNLNQISACINLLTKARIMLPHRLQCHVFNYEDTETVAADWPAGATCGAGDQKVIVFDHSPASAGTLIGESADWEDCEGVSSTSFASLTGACDGTDFVLQSNRTTTRFRYALRDPLAINAIPEDLRTLINDSGVGFVGRKITTTITTDAVQVGSSAESAGCCFAFQEPCPGFFWDGASVGYAFSQPNQETVECGLFTAGLVDVGAPPASDFFFARNMGVGGAECFGGCSTQILIVPDINQSVAYVDVPLA